MKKWPELKKANEYTQGYRDGLNDTLGLCKKFAISVLPKEKIVGEYVEFPITDSEEDEWRRKAIIEYGKRLGANQTIRRIKKAVNEK